MQHIKWQVRMATWTAARRSPHVHLGSKKEKNLGELRFSMEETYAAPWSGRSLPYLILFSVCCLVTILRGDTFIRVLFSTSDKIIIKVLDEMLMLMFGHKWVLQWRPSEYLCKPFLSSSLLSLSRKMNVWEYSEIYFVLVWSSSRLWTARSAS